MSTPGPIPSARDPRLETWRTFLVAHAQVQDVPQELPYFVEFLVWTLAAACGVAAAASLGVAWLQNPQAAAHQSDPPAPS